MLTGSTPFLLEIHIGVTINRQDLMTTNEGADVIIPQQLINANSNRLKNVAVVCDYTYVFVLLLHFYSEAIVMCYGSQPAHWDQP